MARPAAGGHEAPATAAALPTQGGEAANAGSTEAPNSGGGAPGAELAQPIDVELTLWGWCEWNVCVCAHVDKGH